MAGGVTTDSGKEGKGHEEAPRDDEAEILAATRSRTHQLFMRALGYPDDELGRWIGDGEAVQSLRECLIIVAPELCERDEAEWQALTEAGETDDLAVEYTRLFDVGASGPPCPLYGGLYGGARMKVMEEAVRFYNHFGLTLSEEQRELPDHLATELEFLHYLSYREAEALQAGTEAGPYQRAQRDFIERHPGKWLPALCQRLSEAEARPPYRGLLGLLSEWIAYEGQRLSKA